jgi:hypothetical protein
MKRSQLEECLKNWELLGNVTIDEDECIDVPFLTFGVGTE